MTDKNYIRLFSRMAAENRNTLLFSIVIFMVFVFFVELKGKNIDKIRVQLAPDNSCLMTQNIQAAIDSCAENGGGVVVFSAGKYISGGIQLKNHVSLYFEKGAILQGSDKYADYKNDAFIYGKDLTDIAIQGEGIIDGVDCKNLKGEEGFRGPHCIRLINCRKIQIKGITIKNSANWAINCRYCSGALVENVSIRAGHDGLHTRFCSDFTVTGCDFRTGDDAFAGNDNRDFVVTDCKINTSCNGFRMGCLNLTVKRCHFWGPGESIHIISTRKNMLSAFVHFSPDDDSPKLQSGNWLIEDCTIDNVDQVYVYNFLDGLWQTGQPVRSVQFRNIKATGILAAFNIIGDSILKFNLSVKNSSFSFREGFEYSKTQFEGIRFLSPALFNAANFDTITLQNVSLNKLGTSPILNCKSGNVLTLKGVNFTNGNKTIPYAFENVKKIQKTNIKHNNITI